MTAIPLDLIVGPECAAAFIGARVRQLVEQDLIPEARAYDIVCTAALDSDPVTLADPGQTWIPREDDIEDQEHEDNLPAARLYVARRVGPELLLEDEWGQQEWLDVGVLAGYVLDTWLWAREDEDTDTPGRRL